MKNYVGTSKASRCLPVESREFESEFLEECKSWMPIIEYMAEAVKARKSTWQKPLQLVWNNGDKKYRNRNSLEAREASKLQQEYATYWFTAKIPVLAISKAHKN